MATPWSFQRIMNARGKAVHLSDGRGGVLRLLDGGWTWGDGDLLSMREMRAFLEAHGARLRPGRTKARQRHCPTCSCDRRAGDP